MSFLKYYFDLSGDLTEQATLCPFPHTTASGMTYYESNPSAHVNIEKGLFHCKVCGKGYNERELIRQLLGTTLTAAIKIQRAFKNEEDLVVWNNSVTLSESSRQLAASFRISDAVMTELHLGSNTDGTIMFPAFMFDKLVDIRTYNPNHIPKAKSRRGAFAGMIIPYDLWRITDKTRWTLVCAGEKDMAVARSHGFNAITITGGELALPIFMNEFRGRNVAIVYDNDDAGKAGAIKLAATLKPIANMVKNVTLFHEVCNVTKEDITDYFNKYHMHREDLIRCLELTPEFVIPDGYMDDHRPLVTLFKASSPTYLNRLIRSNIQVVATSEQTFEIPIAAVAEKYRESDDGQDTMYAGELREWDLEEHNIQDVLYLMDHRLKEPDIRKNMLNQLLKVPLKERYVRLNSNIAAQVVHKAYVTDMFESGDDSTVSMEYLVYSIGHKLESGKKYTVTYKLTPNPHNGQELVMIVLEATQANDSVSNFKITDSVVAHLNVFTSMQGTVETKVAEMVQRVKGLLGYNGNDMLIRSLDLAYHTPLQFKLGRFTERAYLDTILVGESRVGKSSTAQALLSTYKLGMFTSLAGNSATVAGLIGGSNKTSSGFQTRAGLIPQNHRGLVIFEEFGKCNSNIVKELTDIRSSNEVRIARVSGSITLPAMVRMISLSNVKANGHDIKPIASYPNGISVIAELVGTAEDIARYDMMLVLSDKGNMTIDPFWEPMAPFETEAYMDRVRWVWSRGPEQVIISNDVGHYIMNHANELNRVYDSHIKIFGTEAWKKLARLSIAIAGYVVSTDGTYENIIVTEEHVDYAVKVFKEIYDNDTFRLKEYVEHERKYTTIDADGIATLQDLYMTAPGLLLQLEQEAATNRVTLMSAAGLNADQYNAIINRMLRNMFIRMNSMDIRPTERFRKGMASIERTIAVRRIGEL